VVEAGSEVRVVGLRGLGALMAAGVIKEGFFWGDLQVVCGQEERWREPPAGADDARRDGKDKQCLLRWNSGKSLKAINRHPHVTAVHYPCSLLGATVPAGSAVFRNQAQSRVDNCHTGDIDIPGSS